MISHSIPAVRNLVPEDSSHDGAEQSTNINQAIASRQEQYGVSDPVADYPSNRLIYIDESLMRSISLRLINDPGQFARLKGRAANDNVSLKFINDANAINVVYFAQRIWYVPPSETLMDIPPLDPATSRGELYPGVVVRIRAFLRVKEDLRPGRLRLTSNENERLYVEMANHGVLSINRMFLCNRVLYVVGQLHRIRPLSVLAAAVLLAPLPMKNR